MTEAKSDTHTRNVHARTAAAPLLLHVFPTFAVGGVPLRIATIINSLGEAFRHCIVSLDGRFEASSRLDRNVSVRLLDLSPMRSLTLPARLKGIRRVLADVNSAAVLTYNWGAIEWPAANSLIRIAASVHFESGFGVEEADRQLRRRALLRRVALHRSLRLVVPSQTLARIARDIWKFPACQLQIIPNGVDCVLFDGNPEQRDNGEFRQSADEIIIGTVAPLRPEKNLGRLLRTFASIDADVPARLVIVGEGSERPRLEAEAKPLGIMDRLRFVGHRDDVAHVLRGLDVFALTSETEQMPNAVLQAMASGLPVAAVDVGDVTHMLSPENRVDVVVKTNEAALTQRLVHLARDHARRVALGRCNQAHARAHYSLSSMVGAYADLFQSASRFKSPE